MSGLGEGLRPLDRVRATFQPVRTDDLRPEALAFIGQTCEWQVLWEIEHGPYVGQWAMQPPYSWDFPGWVPMCDLALAAAQSAEGL